MPENTPTTAPPLRIGVAACAGRMGRAIMTAAVVAPHCALAGASQYPGHAAVGKDAGALAGAAPLGVVVDADPSDMMSKSGVVIDFSTPEATLAHLRAACATQTPMVIGTTGLSAAQQDRIAEAAADIAIIAAPNMSVGGNILAGATERLAAMLGTDYDIEVVGFQHRHKVDAPSGTSLALAQAAARGRGVPPETIGATPRDGHTGPRPVGQIGIATIQGGDVTGEHRVVIATDGERLELAHKPAHRGVYAAGAVRAACWLHGRPPGLYTMAEVLELTA